MHDRGAFGQVRAQPHPGGIGNPHSGGDDIVEHPRELVQREHGQAAAVAPQVGPDLIEGLDMTRPGCRPHDIGQDGEDAVDVDRARLAQPVAQQMQPQVGVLGGHRGRIHFDDGADDFGGGLTSFAVHPVRPQRYRGLDARLRLADLRFGIPGVEYLARGMDGS
ncbi:hypothetical protein SDC9_150671 [bioreactor metagenome]|uniref:Uncharacterized protein n=1 Tax=bioreactor metagenome TaxID=1076179 RepID=A0A645EN60_9ZZZZ